jgi:hypothetical protein
MSIRMARALFLVFAACACIALLWGSNSRADIAIAPDRPTGFVMGVRLQMTPAGARVTEIDGGRTESPHGIRRGDLILAVDRIYIQALTPAQRQGFASGVQRRPVKVLLVRNGRDVIEVRAALRS